MAKRVPTWFRNFSLGRKLTAVTFATTGVSLIVMVSVLLMTSTSGFLRNVVRSVGMQAEVVGANSSAAITFHDHRAAQETLRRRAIIGHVVSAAIMLPDGTEFVRYDRELPAPRRWRSRRRTWRASPDQTGTPSGTSRFA